MVEAIQRTAEQQGGRARPSTSRRSRFTRHRRGSPPRTCGRTNARSCAPSSTSTCTGSPTNWRTRRSAKYRADADLDELSFAWAGGVEPGQPHYYRVQGRRLLAEYDNTQRGVNHVHTVWRDLESDFGGDVLGQHYARHDHDDHDAGHGG